MRFSGEIDPFREKNCSFIYGSELPTPRTKAWKVPDETKTKNLSPKTTTLKLSLETFWDQDSTLENYINGLICCAHQHSLPVTTKHLVVNFQMNSGFAISHLVTDLLSFKRMQQNQ